MQKKESITTNESLTAIPFPGDLRDWYAGMAMQGIVTEMSLRLVGGFMKDEEMNIIAIRSFEMANAMLKQREAK